MHTMKNQTEPKRANLGCGFLKLKGFDNIDSSSFSKPDRVIDLNSNSWDIPDNTYDHIVAKDILEHLDDVQNSIREMYRISKDGAFWEVQVPHWGCFTMHDNPTHKKSITPGTFKLYDMEETISCFKKGIPVDGSFLEQDIDLEIHGVQFQYTDVWDQRFKDPKMTEDEKEYYRNHCINVVANYIILVKVNKPPRYSRDDIQKVIDEYLKTYSY